MKDAIITVYTNGVTDKKPNHVTLSKVLEGIRTGGKSAALLEKVSKETDKETRDELKKTLPCICFSGKWIAGRTDASMSEHSGLAVLDYDHLTDDEKVIKRNKLKKLPYIVAIFDSPTGTGLKALARIKDPKKH